MNGPSATIVLCFSNYVAKFFSNTAVFFLVFTNAAVQVKNVKSSRNAFLFFGEYHHNIMPKLNLGGHYSLKPNKFVKVIPRMP
jgi:hypothetical protein